MKKLARKLILSLTAKSEPKVQHLHVGSKLANQQVARFSDKFATLCTQQILWIYNQDSVGYTCSILW